MSKEFKIVTSPRLDRIEEGVNELLNNGWDISGSPFIGNTGSIAIALIKETSPTKKAPANAAAPKRSSS